MALYYIIDGDSNKTPLGSADSYDRAVAVMESINVAQTKSVILVEVLARKDAPADANAPDSLQVDNPTGEPIP